MNKQTTVSKPPTKAALYTAIRKLLAVIDKDCLFVSDRGIEKIETIKRNLLKNKS